MSNIIIRESFTIIRGEETYVLTPDEKGNPDLLLSGSSLKKEKLAKKNAIDLIKELGFEEQLKELLNLKGRILPTTYKVLELLEKIINGDNK